MGKLVLMHQCIAMASHGQQPRIICNWFWTHTDAPFKVFLYQLYTIHYVNCYNCRMFPDRSKGALGIIVVWDVSIPSGDSFQRCFLRHDVFIGDWLLTVLKTHWHKAFVFRVYFLNQSEVVCIHIYDYMETCLTMKGSSSDAIHKHWRASWIWR